jgi:hypothetical protein
LRDHLFLEHPPKTLGAARGRETSSEGTIECTGERVVVVGKEMTVGIHRRADVRVPDVVLDPEGRGALVYQQGDTSMPHAVRIEGPQAGLPHGRVPETTPPAVVVEAAAGRSRKDGL